MFMKLGRDEELMAPDMYEGFSARSSKGRIQGLAKIGHKSPLIKKSVFFRLEGYSNKLIDSNDLEACM